MINRIEEYTEGEYKYLYRLIQGDGFRFSVTETNKDADYELINKITVYIMTKDYCIVFNKDYVKTDDMWILFVEPEDTNKIDIGKYVMDVRVTYADGNVDTIERSKVNIVEQGKDYCGK